MQTRYLFPHSFKKIGWILLIIGIVWTLTLLFFWHQLPGMQLKVPSIYSGYGVPLLNPKGFEYNNVYEKVEGGYTVVNKLVPDRKHWFIMLNERYISGTLISIILIIGAILVSCSKEKAEDEFIAKIRLESLLWATYINYLMLLFSIIFIYDEDFSWVLVYNMFTLLIIFLVRFNFILYKSTRATKNEK